MAQYLHLPIYKTAYDLLLELMQVTKEYPREFKFSHGERIQNTMIELLLCIYKANSAREKHAHIMQILEHAQYLNLFLRISHDLKLIPDNRYSRFVEGSASISKQSGAWLSSVQARQNTDENALKI